MMFLTLCWMFMLSIKLIMVCSVSVQAAAEHECHPWSFYNDTLQQCQCYETMSDFYFMPYKLTECSDRKTSIYIGYCMTTEEQGTFISYCAAYFSSLNITGVNGMYIQLPNNASELNNFMCGSLNRKG